MTANVRALKGIPGILECQDLIHSFYDTGGRERLKLIGVEPYVPRGWNPTCNHSFARRRHAWALNPSWFFKRTKAISGHKCCGEQMTRMKWIHVLGCNKCIQETTEECSLAKGLLCTRCGREYAPMNPQMFI